MKKAEKASYKAAAHLHRIPSTRHSSFLRGITSQEQLAFREASSGGRQYEEPVKKEPWWKCGQSANKVLPSPRHQIMASVIQNRSVRSSKRSLSSVNLSGPLTRSPSEKALHELVRKSYSPVRIGLRTVSAKNLPRYEYHPEFRGRVIGPVRTSTAFIPNAFFAPTHAIYDEPVRLHDIYSPWSWPYAYQDSRVIRKDPALQGAQAVEPFYTNRSRSYPRSQARISRYYAGEVDQFIRDSDRATDAYLRWSLGVESGTTPSYRSRYADEGFLGRLGFYRPAMMERYQRSPWKV